MGGIYKEQIWIRSSPSFSCMLSGRGEDLRTGQPGLALISVARLMSILRILQGKKRHTFEVESEIPSWSTDIVPVLSGRM
jgi:hypothetical protein